MTYRPDDRAGLELPSSVGRSSKRPLQTWLSKAFYEEKSKMIHMSSPTALSDSNKRTISILDPYTPIGLMMKSSKALKSTLVTDAYAPGRIVLMKRLRES